MGQYYSPVILEDDKKTIKGWANSHDYGSGLKLMEHSWIGNSFVARIEKELEGNPQRLVWAGDYAEHEDDKDNNLHVLADESGKKLGQTEIGNPCRYIANHDKRVYIDKEEIAGDDWQIHPLPLLTAEGNGQGGGDYRGSCLDDVGVWARDKISLEVAIPQDFEEVRFEFLEG